MTRLTFETMNIPAASLNGESSLPPIDGLKNGQQQTKTRLDEDDELFIGYGFLDGGFPYRAQDMYDRQLNPTDIKIAVLENDHLKAIFVPSLGGRLWSLYDKQAQKELLFRNPVLRYGNLAIRNAWFSGGVEFNCGQVGHHNSTCSEMFTASLTDDDGTPVLRMYQFERVRAIVYQMDFFLPEDSKLLFCRMRIVNHHPRVIPMYWWSNIAVPELQDGRVIIPADETYTNRNSMVSKTTVPISGDVDITYPVNNPIAIDFFWKLHHDKRRYVCQAGKDGYGLIQTSTKRLKGRKLFVWGQGPGGDKWQEYLSQKGDGRYAEIQAGLACTQYECLPMPPRTAWEWLEAYGALNADGSKLHGDWQVAKQEVEKGLETLISEEALEALLITTRHSIALKPAEKVITYGNGWAALEDMRRRKAGYPPLPEHLDYGKTGVEQNAWVQLLETNTFPEPDPDQVPASYMGQEEWQLMLAKVVEASERYNWYANMQYGMMLYSAKAFDQARLYLNRSMELRPSCWAMYGLAMLDQLEGNTSYTTLAQKLALTKSDDISIVKAALRLLIDAEAYQDIVSLSERLPDAIRANPRVRQCTAFAYVRLSDAERAEEILFANGYAEIADIREGENSVTDIWYEIQEQKARKKGEAFDRDQISPPPELDFRMNAQKRMQ